MKHQVGDQEAALRREAGRVELEWLAKHRPSELARRGITLEQAQQRIDRRPTTVLDRWARQVGRGRKPGKKAKDGTKALGPSDARFAAELAKHFNTHDGLTRKRAITEGIKQMYKVTDREGAPIHSTFRQRVSREFDRLGGRAAVTMVISDA